MDKGLDIEKTNNGVLFKVKVQPLVRDDEIVGVQGDTLKIKINAPPVKGKVNKALVDFLNALIPTPSYKEECPDIGHCS